MNCRFELPYSVRLVPTPLISTITSMDTHWYLIPTHEAEAISPAPLQQYRFHENHCRRPRNPFLQPLFTRTTLGATSAFGTALAPACSTGRADSRPWSSPSDLTILRLSRSFGSLDLGGRQPRDSDESAERDTSRERSSYHVDDVNDGTSSRSNRDLPPSANTRSRHRQGSDGGGSPPRGRQPEGRSFNSWGRPKSTGEINNAIKDLLLRCHPNADEGFVYGFQHPDDAALDPLLPENHNWTHLIKIGRSKNHQTRMKQIRKQCKYNPHTVFAHFMPRHGMVERVVHTQLHNSRLRDAGCFGCGARHEEWFRVDVRLAEDVVELWKAFVECSPYDEQGVMLPEWRERLEQLDLQDADCWTRFVHDAPSTRPVAGSPQELEAGNAYVGLATGRIDPSSEGDSGGEQEEGWEVI